VPETLEKLRPDRDLQCYFERPSAIAAMSGATAAGYTLSGTWRQQFDWAVVEWNQHNVFEHPAFRNLPDGDLSGLKLTYEETRENCVPIDSDLYPTVDWHVLRIWTREGGADDFYKVLLKDKAVPVEGSYVPAAAQFTLQGGLTPGDFVGIACLGEHHTYQVLAGDTLESAAQAIVESVNAFSGYLKAARSGATITLHYVGLGQTMADSTTGANGNRVGAYAYVAGAKTESFSPEWTMFSGGQSPTKWRVTIDFGSLIAMDGRTVPASAIRKMRWTYAAELQAGEFARSEYRVVVSNWSVTGTNRGYLVAGRGTQRIEDDSPEVSLAGSWQKALGNFSGGTIHHTTSAGAKATWTYTASAPHRLYLGTRYAFNASLIQVQVDGGAAHTFNLLIPGEDQLFRQFVAALGPGTHTVEATHAGPAGSYFYFDFFEVCIPTSQLPVFPIDNKVTLATDWDTDHSIAVPAERTAWMIDSLGFHGRANHYVGALWFYELRRKDHEYASATIDFTGTPVFSQVTTLRVGRVGEPASSDAVIDHLNLIGDTAASIAKAFELELNRGYTAVRAEASGNRLTIYSRTMGEDGNQVRVSATPDTGSFRAEASGATLAGGVNGEWVTDTAALPRLNRAVRDWSRAFFTYLSSRGIDAASAFSTELQHGDRSVAAGIAQRYPSGNPVELNTPAVQTNFSPAATAYWRQVYLEMAQLMAQGGLVPYMQFGEVQWWYFPYDGSGMPFYDAYSTSTFASTYGRPMAVIPNQFADPALYPDEMAFLPQLIGDYTNNIMAFVRAALPQCRFEVLYPTDVNETALNSAVNYPASAWTPANLDSLKTESFTYTFARNLDLASITVNYGATRAFPRSKASFLVGIGDSHAAWRKEVDMAKAQNLESIVLFALDQYCLIGYETPVGAGLRRASEMGV
jgi:hypothetical protein